MNKLYALCSVILLTSCVSSGDLFMVKSLDPSVKAEAVVQQGIAFYNQHLVGRGEHALSGECRRYFEIALEFDPDNAKAVQYLEKVDDYKSSYVSAKIKEAVSLHSKSPRSETENYTLFVSINAALEADPENEQARKLLKEHGKGQSALVSTYLERSKEAQRKVTAKSSDSSSETYYVEAYLNARKASMVDPDNSSAVSQKLALYRILSGINDRRASQMDAFIAEGSWDKARSQLSLIAGLNKKVGGDFSEELDKKVYAFNYRWAKSLYDDKDYPQALARVNIALDSRETGEALQLKRRISEKADAIDGAASLDETLQQIDAHIAKGELLSASSKIDALSSRYRNDPANTDKIAERRKKVQGSLSDVYAKGLVAYRAENFRQAIQFFNTVVRVDAEYEQASVYLGKAREKQKLIEQFSE